MNYEWALAAEQQSLDWLKQQSNHKNYKQHHLDDCPLHYYACDLRSFLDGYYEFLIICSWLIVTMFP